MANSTYVTIDWDFFIPEDPMWDFGHKEAPFFLKQIWGARIRYFREMATTGEEREFWDKLWDKLPLPVCPSLRVSESHLAVWNDPALHMANAVVLIDQHHDMFGDGKSDTVDCGNWLAAWLRQKRNRRAIWVRPDHSWGEGLPDGNKFKFLRSRTVVLDSIDELDPRDMPNATLHVCRSGAWTPPWLDAQFNRFVEASKLPQIVLDRDWSDPTQPRFTLTDYRQAFEAQKQWQQMLARHKDFAARIAPSDNDHPAAEG